MSLHNSFFQYVEDRAPILYLAVKLSLRPNDLGDNATCYADFQVSNQRDVQVIDAVVANNANSDAPNPDSIYSQTLYRNGNPADGLTPAGDALFGISLGLIAVSLIAKIGERYNKLKAQSSPYMEACIRAIDPEFNQTTAEIEKDLNQFLMRGKIPGRKTNKGYRVRINKYKIVEFTYNENDILFATTEYDSNSDPVEDQLNEEITELFKPSLFFRIINAIRNSRLSTWTRSTWDFLFNSSMVNWVFWYPLMVLGGIAAVSLTGGGILPVLAAYALIPTAAYMIYTAGYYLINRVFGKKNKNGPVSLDATNDPEEEYKVKKVMQRYVVKRHHLYNRDSLFAKAAGFVFHRDSKKLESEDEISQNETTQSRWKEKWANIKKRVKEDEEALIRDTMPDLYPMGVPSEFKRESPEVILNSELAQYLLGSKPKRYTRSSLIFFRDVVNGFVMVLFIVSLLSTILAAPALLPFIPAALLPSLAGGALFLGGSTLTANIIVTSICAGVGLLFGINSLVKTHTADVAREKNVYEKLSAQYKNEGISKLEKFERNQILIEEKINNIRKLREGFCPANEAEQVYLKYKLEDVNVYNDYYFEKYKQAPSIWTRTKQVCKGAFEGISGAQGLIYTARFLFLVGGVASFALLFTGAGTLAAFLTVALTMGLAGGLIRLSAYQMEREQRHKDAFANSIDERISYQRKKLNELTFIEAGLKEEKELTSTVSQPGKLNTATQVDEVEVLAPRVNLVLKAPQSVTPVPSLSLFADHNEKREALIKQLISERPSSARLA